MPSSTAQGRQKWGGFSRPIFARAVTYILSYRAIPRNNRNVEMIVKFKKSEDSNFSVRMRVERSTTIPGNTY